MQGTYALSLSGIMSSYMNHKLARCVFYKTFSWIIVALRMNKSTDCVYMTAGRCDWLLLTWWWLNSQMIRMIFHIPLFLRSLTAFILSISFVIELHQVSWTRVSYRKEKRLVVLLVFLAFYDFKCEWIGVKHFRFRF